MSNSRMLSWPDAWEKVRVLWDGQYSRCLRVFLCGVPEYPDDHSIGSFCGRKKTGLASLVPRNAAFLLTAEG
jgi:hypothetical protein